MGDRPTVGLQILDLAILVRIQVSQPLVSLYRRSLTVQTPFMLGLLLGLRHPCWATRRVQIDLNPAVHVVCGPMPRKIKTNVYLSPKQMAALKRISKKTDVPMAVLIRRGVDLLLARHPRKTT